MTGSPTPTSDLWPLISDLRPPPSPSDAKFLLTLHERITGRALTVQGHTTHDYGVTAGMSHVLGEIENVSSHQPPEPKA